MDYTVSQAGPQPPEAKESAAHGGHGRHGGPDCGAEGHIWVPNEKAANEFIVAPNNAVTLWDMNAPVVYVKKADASGKPTMTTYDLVERSTAPVSPTAPQTVPTVEYVTRKDFDELAAKVAALSVKPVRNVKEAENESTV